MSMKINKVKQLLENTYCEDGKPLTVSQKIEKMFGIQEDTATCETERGEIVEHVWRKRVDPQAAHDLDNLSPLAIGREMVGPDFQSKALEALYDPTFWPTIKSNMKRAKRLREEDSSGVTASMMEPVNTWGSFTLGLFDFKILEGYQFHEAIYEKLIPTRPTAIAGSQKHLQADYDGTVILDPVSEGQAAHTVGAKPAWVFTQPIEEHHSQYEIKMEALMSDLSGGLQKLATGVGEAVKKAENYRAARYYLGYNNQYCYNTKDNSTPSCNSFQSSAGSAPFDFVNLYYSSALTDVASLNAAYLSMLQLTDPVRGWRINPGKRFKLVVTPDLVFTAGEIVKLITSYRATGGGVNGQTFSSGTSTNAVGRLGEGPNPLMIAGLDFEVVNMSYEWRDQLTGSKQAYSTWVDYQGKVANSSALNPITGTADAPGTLMSSGNIAGFWMLVADEMSPPVIHEPWIPMRSEYLSTNRR